MNPGTRIRVINETVLHGMTGTIVKWRSTDEKGRLNHRRVNLDKRGDGFVFPLIQLEEEGEGS